MKLLFFKTSILMLITSISTNAQVEHIYSNSFEVNAHTIATLNLKNVVADIKVSTDDKIHFDYSIEFRNFNQKEIDSLLEGIEVTATMKANRLTLSALSSTMLGLTVYHIDTPLALTNVSDFLLIKKDKNKEEKVSRVSKDSILRSIGKVYNAETAFNKLRVLDENGEEKPLDIKSLRMHKSRFTIKVPDYVMLKIKGNEAQIKMEDEMINELSMDLDRGLFQALSLSNRNNKIKVNYIRHFKVASIEGGDYTITNVKKALIGSINGTRIHSEFSKIEIGEIQEDNIITDFNSEFWIYNWTPNFKRFNMYSEYSKINLFYPESKYSLSTFGLNTKHHLLGAVGIIGPSKSGDKTKMLIIGDQKTAQNKIDMDISHGVIRLDKEVISVPRN